MTPTSAPTVPSASTPPAPAAVEPALAAAQPAPAPAAVIENPPLPARAIPSVAAATSAVRCENCGGPVQGRYCGNCGQRLEPPVHSLWHFTKVATEDLTHADSRLWRTLAALLFKPGHLTREFLRGRRASYLPPVRLYLVLSVAFFLYAALGHGDKPAEAVAQGNQSECASMDYRGPWQARLTPAIRSACLKISADKGRSLQEALYHNMPRAMFLFLPLLAGAMMLMYWWPRHYYVEHLLLFVHNHAAVFLILMLAWGLSALLPPAARWVHFAVALYIPWYVFRSMRIVYAQGRGLTLAKLLPLSFFYLVSGLLMFALAFIYSVLTL